LQIKTKIVNCHTADSKLVLTGGQWYSDTSPFSIPWYNGMAYLYNGRESVAMLDGSTYVNPYVNKNYSKSSPLIEIINSSITVFLPLSKYLFMFGQIHKYLVSHYLVSSFLINKESVLSFFQVFSTFGLTFECQNQM